MTKQLFEYKFIEKLLQNSKDIIIGVSGGKDSIAMLHQILEYREKLNKNFKVLHVDHQINSNSGKWAEFVTTFCNQYNIPVDVIRVDVARERNLELAARKARYAAYSEQDFDTIILGHHANDQIETFFMKLFRGSGVRGLRCMEFLSECWFDKEKSIVRPLLEKTRFDIDSYVEHHNIPFVEDPSNADTTLDRNWIRHELVPTIMDRNNIADMNIIKSISIQGEALELMTDLAYIDYEACKTSNPDELNWYKFKSLSLVRLKNLIMTICNDRGYFDISTHNVEQFARGILNSDEESKTELRIRSFRMQKVGKIIKIFIEE